MYGFFEWLRTRGFGNSRVIPSLDGLRAIAVLLVLVSHLCGTVNFWLPLASIGVLSYSLYLWQQPFSTFGMKNYLSAFPLNVLLMFTTAILSYLLIETPFLRLRSDLERRATDKQVSSSAISP